MPPLVVSYYTPAYKKYSIRLGRSLARFGIDHRIYEAPNRGSWVENCAQKAAFMVERMQEFDQPLLWLDADAEVQHPLALFDEISADFAIHQVANKRPHLRFRSGTIFFRPAAFSLLMEWAMRCKQNPRMWDQEHLLYAWECERVQPTTHWLPITYCQRIGEPDLDDDDAVILHHQASRKEKRAAR
jgi:hypothetical protein